MTKEHYIEIARMLKEQREEYPHNEYIIGRITLELADIMKRDNPRFKAGQFFEAAGFPWLTGVRQGLN